MQYENRGRINDVNLINVNQEMEIPVFLCYENFFLSDESKQIRTPKKYNFKGYFIFGRNQPMMPIAAKIYEKELKNEFGISADLENYEFYYGINIYKECEKNRFVIVETFILKKIKSIRNTLNVNRCKFALNLTEVTQHICNFALSQDVKQIEFILAETLTKDEDIESFLK